MANNIETAIPLECVPGAIPAAERPQHFARLRHLFDTLPEQRIDVADGYAWRFPAHALDEVTSAGNTADLIVHWDRTALRIRRSRESSRNDGSARQLRRNGRRAIVA